MKQDFRYVVMTGCACTVGEMNAMTVLSNEIDGLSAELNLLKVYCHIVVTYLIAK